MKIIYPVLIILLLVSCVPSTIVSPPLNAPNPSSTSMFTLHPETSLPFFTETPTFAPTLTFTANPTLSPEQYPKLADFVLRPEDVPDDAYYFKSYFWSGSDHNIPPSITDITSSLKERNLCSLDCVEVNWRNSSNYMEISLVRQEDARAAINASFELCTKLLHDATLHWETPWAPSSFDDCQSEMSDKAFTPYTWILGFTAADVYGSVLIITHIDIVGGDDMTIYKDTLHYLLEFQIKKLKQVNYPISP